MFNIFMNCSNLNSISIGDGIMSIGKVAFSGCKSLSSIAIPNSVTSIGDYAFRWCYSLTSVAIPNSVTSIGEFAFYECKGLTSVIIGNNVTSIGNSAFRGCSGLTSIIIPNSVSSIGNEAFQGYELLEVISKIKNPFIINTNTFSHNTFNNATLYVPAGTIAKYKATESWNNFVFIKEENADKYKLTYLVDNEEYKSCDLEEGESIIPEDEPTKEGYTFSGWSEIPETMPAHDVTVTGSFTINKYKLVYKVDGEDYKSYEVEYGATITPEEEPTKEGYTFSGWSEIPGTMPAKDVTVTGIFSVNKYKLVYKVDGEEYKSYEVEYGTTITPEEEPTKEGYTFSGWSWIPSKMPAENVTITGSFKINQYTITYVIDGEVYQTEKVDYNSKITPPTPPEKEGYDFAWGDYPETMPAHDITITGTYTTGIISIEMESGNAKIFTLEGKQVELPKKGVNIVRMGNGAVKKIVMK